jgi:hypothetical protein
MMNIELELESGNNMSQGSVKPCAEREREGERERRGRDIRRWMDKEEREGAREWKIPVRDRWAIEQS